MPKRPLDLSTPVADRSQRRTERSHEENQERAYIAASRRVDRSIEARVQSAKMASEIHKKRTGKGFKISEEIVMKEEMYEEEDDDLPRHYRGLAAHLQTSSADMNNRLTAYITNQVAMASLARQQEINRMFAEQFPNASQISQQLSQSAYFQPLQTNQGNSMPLPLQDMPQTTPPHSFSLDRSHPIHQTSPRPSGGPTGGHHRQSPIKQQLPVDDSLSPPALTPSSGNTDTPHLTPQFSRTQMHNTNMTLSSAIDESLELGEHQSSFTSELPQDAKLLANIDLSDPLAGAFYGMPTGEMLGSGSVNMFQFSSTAMPFNSTYSMKEQAVSSLESDYFGQSIQPPSRSANLPTEGSRIGTPGGGDGDSWAEWVNPDAWVQLGDVDDSGSK